MIVINIIPSNYSGDPHDAPGYAWSNLIMDGYKVNKDKSIPGIDLVGVSFDDVVADLQHKYGRIAIRCNDNYGFLANTAKTVDGRTVSISEAQPIAYVNCMWAGGGSYDIFLEPEPVSPTDADAVNAAQEQTAPTPSITDGMSFDEIKRAEQAYDMIYNEGGEGYNPYRN